MRRERWAGKQSANPLSLSGRSCCMLLRQLRSLIGSRRLGARFSARAQRGSRGRLFEQLESRCVLSCTAVVDPLKSALVVTGDGGANKVAIRNDDLQGIVVTCDGS